MNIKLYLNYVKYIHSAVVQVVGIDKGDIFVQAIFLIIIFCFVLGGKFQ